MDTGKKHIEMCEKAKEIQAINNETGYQLGNFYICEDGLFVYDGHNNLEIWEDFNDSKAIWLPRQDQLQEMMINKYKFVELQEKFVWFIGWVFDYIDNRSYEMCWLAYVMYEKFNKVWDGKEWIKEDE